MQLVKTRVVPIGPVLGLGLAALAVAAVPSAARAQDKPSAQQQTPTMQARARLQEAQTKLNEAKAAAAAARGKIEQRFKVRPDWAQAEQDLAKAKADHQTAVSTSMENRKGREDYKAATAAKLAAEAKQRALLDGGQATPQQLNAAGDELAKAATDVRRMEGEAMADPRILEAKTRLVDAERRMAALREEVEKLAKTDKDCLAADQRVTSAQQAVANAQQSVVSAQKSESDSRAARSRTNRRTGP